MIDLSRSSRKPAFEVKSEHPGPGHYGLSHTTTRAHSFATSSRCTSLYSTEGYEDMPGPGTYAGTQLRQQSPKAPFQSTASRFGEVSPSKMPGPGAYNVQPIPEVPAPSTPAPKLLVAPEPVPASIPQPSWHERVKYDGQKQTVSPANYKPKYTLVKKAAASPAINKAKHELWDKHNPITKINSVEGVGPGTYFDQPPEEESDDEFAEPKPFISGSSRFRASASGSRTCACFNSSA